MISRAHTVAFQGIEARPVEVQCSMIAGLPAFAIVGLPDKAVSEARERVRAAFAAMSIALPAKRITVNLSPADLPKEGSYHPYVRKKFRVFPLVCSHSTGFKMAVLFTRRLYLRLPGPP